MCNVSDEVIPQNYDDPRQVEELVRRNRVIFSKLRGTQAFWDEQKTRINHMIAALGVPTAWVTFSSADTFWPDMEKYLQS